MEKNKSSKAVGEDETQKKTHKFENIIFLSEKTVP